MNSPLQRPATTETLNLWVLHRFTEVFGDHAIVKGGIAFQLFDCPRFTNDIDYVFVPYKSKDEIVDRLRAELESIEGSRVSVDVHSKMIRARLRVDDAAIQIEANVEQVCPSTAVSTAALAHAHGQPSRLIRVVALEHALANKLAAWNERRIIRDLYDIYYIASRLGARYDESALRQRLSRVDSRIPALKKRKSMSVIELADELSTEVEKLNESAVQNELARPCYQ